MMSRFSEESKLSWMKRAACTASDSSPAESDFVRVSGIRSGADVSTPADPGERFHDVANCQVPVAKLRLVKFLDQALHTAVDAPVQEYLVNGKSDAVHPWSGRDSEPPHKGKSAPKEDATRP